MKITNPKRCPAHKKSISGVTFTYLLDDDRLHGFCFDCGAQYIIKRVIAAHKVKYKVTWFAAKEEKSDGK